MIVSTLLLLTRPEGIFVFIIIIIPIIKDNILIQNKKLKWINRNLYLLLIPIGFLFLQYVTFYFLTGRFSANGMVQKSIFYNPTATIIQSIEWIATDFGKILKIMLGGFWFDSEISFVLFIPLFFILFIGCISLIYNNKWSLLLQIIALFVGCVLMTMSLETRLWHFHRYQIPFFFPYILLLVFGLLFTYKTIFYFLNSLFRIISRQRSKNSKSIDERINVQFRYLKIHLKDKINLNVFDFKNNLMAKTIIALLILIPILFYGYYSYEDISKDVLFYSEGCKSTYLQQIDMGNYINDNLPSTANVIVHDAGAIKYLSKSYITDIVGLCHNDFPIINRLGYLGVLERIKNLTILNNLISRQYFLDGIPLIDIF